VNFLSFLLRGSRR